MDTSTLPPPSASGPPPSASSAPSPAGSRPPASRRARTAWKAAASIAAVVVLLWGASQAVSLLAHEERTTTSEFEATGLTLLDVNIDSGSLTVVGTDADVVKVTAHISDGLRSTSVRESVNGDRLELRGGCAPLFSNFCNVAYTVEMPARMAVRARLGNDDIRLTAVAGDVDAHTDNGTITVRGSGRGALVLRSDNGDVSGIDLRAGDVSAASNNGDVSLSFERPPSTVEGTSDNGDVTVEVPDDGTSYAVTTSSSNGSTAAPIRTDPASGRHVTAKSHNGDVQVTYLTN